MYLATVVDAHSRRVIGWAIADHMRTGLIQDALKMAMVLRGDRRATVIFTATAAPNTPRHRSQTSLWHMASLARWD
ncbi:DDE-type integrase/transposase/recombinase [Cryobacterium sp. Y57]|uniref:DDE-type integrase/transposase/recombinase n=1 Tax=Cryobacterium sp. Y57 TaxID=2048287 RepID=UPI0011B0DD4E|nr:DDE-type integrase/transposase/recombinase [Cryobacterium sp. Y57]